MMACKPEDIKRNWEYGWSEPNQNWIWPITNKRRKESTMLMQHGFIADDVRITYAMKKVIREFDEDFGNEDSLPDELFILVTNTDEGVDITSTEIQSFKDFCADNDMNWAVVNAKHIIIDALICRFIGKHTDDTIHS